MCDYLYLCDPEKNTSCRKTFCKALVPGFGKCEYTLDPNCSKDGCKYYFNQHTLQIERLPESESKRYADLAKSYTQGLQAGLAESEE